MPQETMGRHEEGRAGDQDAAVHNHHPALAARRRDRRADDLNSMVREDRAAGESRPGGREGWAHTHRAGPLREGVLQLDGEHQGLVHQPAAMVGAPHPGVVLPGRTHDHWPRGSERLRHLRLEGTQAGFGRTGYLVLLGALAVFHVGLAGTDAGPQVLLSHVDHGNGLRHPVLLGGAHDHDGTGVHRAKRRSTRYTCMV